jgi:hypothetical protein
MKPLARELHDAFAELEEIRIDAKKALAAASLVR